MRKRQKPSTKVQNTSVTIRLAPDQIKALDILRAGAMKTRSTLIREILDAHLTKRKK